MSGPLDIGKQRWRPYRLVAVEWEDSQRPESPWQWVDEFAIQEPIRCVSVGFVIAETKTAIAIAPNLGGNCDRTRACGIIRIPSSAIRNIFDL